MKDITAEKDLVSYCGLYCGACKSYLKEKCPGCRIDGKYKKCKMRPCCLEHEYQSCADCTEFPNVADCGIYSNRFWDIMEFFFRTQRSACIDMIKRVGYQDFAEHMAENKLVVLKRGRRRETG